MDNKQWEINYKNGLEINKYPFDCLISFWFRYKHLIKSNNIIKICEFGCGCGNNLWFFAENGCEVYGIDISETAIMYSKDIFKKKNLNGIFLNTNILNNNFPDDYFDLVIDRGCITHNPGYINECIDESYRILKKGGLFFSFSFMKNHDWLSSGLKINKNYYDFKKENHPWFNLPVNVIDEMEIFDLYKKFKILNYDMITHKNIDNQTSSHIHVYCQK